MHYFVYNGSGKGVTPYKLKISTIIKKISVRDSAMVLEIETKTSYIKCKKAPIIEFFFIPKYLMFFDCEIRGKTIN